MNEKTQQPAEQLAGDPEIVLRLPLTRVNFILQSLDANPLKVSVMEAASLISNIQQQATTPPPAAPEPAPKKPK